MARDKGTRPPKRRSRHSQKFPEFKGKIVDRIGAYITDHGCAIGILFDDKMYLSFEIKQGLTILPDLSDWKTENYKALKRWRPIST